MTKPYVEKGKIKESFHRIPIPFWEHEECCFSTLDCSQCLCLDILWTTPV